MRLGVTCNANAEGTIGEALDRVRVTIEAAGTANLREHYRTIDDQLIEIVKLARRTRGLNGETGRVLLQPDLVPGMSAAEYAKLNADTVRTFKQCAIELGSEPGYPWQDPKIPAPEYAKICREASLAIRAAEREVGCGPCKILVSVDGGYRADSVPDPRDPTGRLRTFYWLAGLEQGVPGFGAFFDICACHPYPHGIGLTAGDAWRPGYLRPIGQWREWWGYTTGYDKPFAVTEWNLLPPYTEEEQANALARVHYTLANLNAWGFWPWMAHDKGPVTSTLREDNQGLLFRRDGSQKLAAAVMRELAKGPA
jgi:hypothetical protein